MLLAQLAQQLAEKFVEENAQSHSRILTVGNETVRVSITKITNWMEFMSPGLLKEILLEHERGSPK